MVVELLLAYSYLILFLGVVVEGEIFPLAAGFLTTTNEMDLYPVLGITFVGVVLGDMLWFGAARRWGRPFLDRWGRFLLLKGDRLESIQRHFQENGKKTLAITKFIYSFGHISIVVAGIARMDWKEFIKIDVPMSFLWTCLFVFLGRAFGSSFLVLRDALKDVAWAAIIVTVLFIGVNYLARRRLAREV